MFCIDIFDLKTCILIFLSAICPKYAKKNVLLLYVSNLKVIYCKMSEKKKSHFKKVPESLYDKRKILQIASKLTLN